MRPTFRSPDAPSASFTVPEVPNLADAGEMQPVRQERSRSPTDLVLERQAPGFLPLPLRRSHREGGLGATAHAAGRKASISSPLTIRLHPSKAGMQASVLLCLPCCFGRLGLADKTLASMMSRTAVLRHSMAPTGLITPGLDAAVICERSQQATTVVPRAYARSSCAVLECGM
jgi:hypothetical protein